MRHPWSIQQYIRIFIIVNITTYTTYSALMAPKKENTKKVAGNAKKAEVAAQKQAEQSAKVGQQEDQEWSKGAKSNAKKEAAALKAAEAASKKAERDALLAAEEAHLPSKPKSAGAKAAPKKSKGTLNLSSLDGEDSAPSSDPSATATRTINASGIDNALDALDITTTDANAQKIDRHPERRFKAAYRAFEERRLPEIEVEHPGLRKKQREDICRKEFERSEENPFNQAGLVGYDAGKEEVAEHKKKVREGIEGRLAEK